jgi:hypothetical protein
VFINYQIFITLVGYGVQKLSAMYYGSARKKGSLSVIFSFMLIQAIKMILLNLQTEPVLDLVKVS